MLELTYYNTENIDNLKDFLQKNFCLHQSKKVI